MRHVIATMLDAFKSQRRQESPHHQAWHLKPTKDAIVPIDPPHLNLTTDPMGQWGDALQRFHSWQLESGFDLMRSGLLPQTASDLQNVMLAQDHRSGLMGSSPYPIPMPTPTQHEPRHVEPWNNPLSTVPGAPFPLKMPGM